MRQLDLLLQFIIYLNCSILSNRYLLLVFFSSWQYTQSQCGFVPLLWEKTHRWVQNVQSPRAHETWRASLHHWEGHLCQMGNTSQNRVQTSQLESLKKEIIFIFFAEDVACAEALSGTCCYTWTPAFIWNCTFYVVLNRKCLHFIDI